MTTPNQEAYLSETLSAIMDGEASDIELRRFLKACESDESIKQTWARMQLVRSAMQNDLSESNVGVAPFDLSKRVFAAIEQEPVHSLEAEPIVDKNTVIDKSAIADKSATEAEVVSMSAWRRALSGLGRVSVAASVAAGVLYIAGSFQPDEPSLNQEPSVVADAEITIPAQDRVLVETTENVAVQPVNMPIGHRSGLLSARTVSTGEFSPVQNRSGLPIAFPRSEVPVSFLHLDDYMKHLKRRSQRQQSTFPLPMDEVQDLGSHPSP